nr:MAG TPA: hypothetical protein [Caudoviricetes sp.]
MLANDETCNNFISLIRGDVKLLYIKSQTLLMEKYI